MYGRAVRVYMVLGTAAVMAGVCYVMYVLMR